MKNLTVMGLLALLSVLAVSVQAFQASTVAASGISTRASMLTRGGNSGGLPDGSIEFVEVDAFDFDQADQLTEPCPTGCSGNGMFYPSSSSLIPSTLLYPFLLSYCQFGNSSHLLLTPLISTSQYSLPFLPFASSFLLPALPSSLPFQVYVPRMVSVSVMMVSLVLIVQFVCALLPVVNMGNALMVSVSVILVGLVMTVPSVVARTLVLVMVHVISVLIPPVANVSVGMLVITVRSLSLR